MTCNDSLTNKIIDICNNECNFFFNKPNVVALGLGFKTKNSCYTNKKCIKIFVSQKLPCNKLPEHDLIPLTYKGILTDVTESGVPLSCSLTSRIRPVIGGYNIGNLNNLSESGTLGCLVTNGHENFFLSNNHVLANENTLPLNSPIVQPSLQCGGNPEFDIFGYLYKYVPLKITHSNTIQSNNEFNLADCALGNLSSHNIVSPSIAYIGKLKGIRPVYLNQSVQKIGSESSRTYGYVLATNVTMNVYYTKGISSFKNQIATSKMTYPGDSGSILADKDNYALGLAFSSTSSHSFFNPIDVVLSLLSVHLITN